MRRPSRLVRAGISAAIVLAGLGLHQAVVRPWLLAWGATETEVREALPGDDLVRQPQLTSTRAITIDATPADVWPWLVQMGQGRGGFYSYDWLENLLGFDIHSADRIIPELQNLKVGDTLVLHSNAPPLRVAVLEPRRALVLGASWAFVLKPIDATTTRLIVRSRGTYTPEFGTLRNLVIWRGFYEPAYFIMERRMILGIKERAESTAASRPPRTAG